MCDVWQHEDNNAHGAAFSRKKKKSQTIRQFEFEFSRLQLFFLSGWLNFDLYLVVCLMVKTSKLCPKISLLNRCSSASSRTSLTLRIGTRLSCHVGHSAHAVATTRPLGQQATPHGKTRVQSTSQGLTKWADKDELASRRDRTAQQAGIAQAFVHRPR